MRFRGYSAVTINFIILTTAGLVIIHAGWGVGNCDLGVVAEIERPRMFSQARLLGQAHQALIVVCGAVRHAESHRRSGIRPRRVSPVFY